MPETLIDFATGWLAVVAGILGVVLAVAVYALRKRFAGGVLGRGFTVWVFAIFLWGFSMLREGVMGLFFQSNLTELLHQILMAAGLVVGLAGTYVFYGMPRG